MTAFADDPVLGMMTEHTDLLLQSVARLDERDLRAPSRLPGWTRGHVLTHVARNADALGNVVRSGVTGQITPMYESTERRNADIEEGSGRSPADIEADIESSAERLLALLADVPADRLDVAVPTGRGFDMRLLDVPWMRLREVSYHHVDLGVGFSLAVPPGAGAATRPAGVPGPAGGGQAWRPGHGPIRRRHGSAAHDR